eukprot:SAG31_NODE_135_length_23206_cov_25.707967_14_plen_55_part_00
MVVDLLGVEPKNVFTRVPGCTGQYLAVPGTGHNLNLVDLILVSLNLVPALVYPH